MGRMLVPNESIIFNFLLTLFLISSMYRNFFESKMSHFFFLTKYDLNNYYTRNRHLSIKLFYLLILLWLNVFEFKQRVQKFQKLNMIIP